MSAGAASQVPPMPEQTRDLPSVSDTIADYNTAIEADDRVVASRMLEALEDAAYANEADWHVTSNFLQRNGLNARLEIVTKILIRTIRPQSARPYLLLANLTAGAGRLDEARSFMTQYREFFGDIPAERWDVLNAYFVVEDYPRCLEVTEIGLAETPNNLSLLFMQIRTLWKLKKAHLAKEKFKIAGGHLGIAAGNWLWYANIATEIQEPDRAQKTLEKLIEMIAAGKSIINKDVAHVLNQPKQKDTLNRLLSLSKPESYNSIEERLFLFELAHSRGVYKTAEIFGRAILEGQVMPAQKDQVTKRLAEPQFLGVRT
jgi:tetratricopeptide (TPR) repeat protein